MPKKTTATTKKVENLSVSIMDTNGKESGTIRLHEEIFGIKPNLELLAQAVHVYRTNSRQGTVAVKTRSEVRGSTRKIYKQKGTGHARHGARKAPIFVGGGIAHGPKTRTFELGLSKAMTRSALKSALSSKYKDGGVIITDGHRLLPSKTGSFVKAFQNVGATGRTLFIVDSFNEDMKRAVRNIRDVDVVLADHANALDILHHKTVVLAKEALDVLTKRLTMNSQKVTKEAKSNEPQKEIKKAVVKTKKTPIKKSLSTSRK